MTPSEAFKAMSDAKQALVEHCGIDCAWYDFVDEREQYWRLDGTSEVQFGPTTEEFEPKDGDDWFEGATYSNEIIRDKVWRGAEVTAMLVDNSCGEQYVQFFDNSKEIK